MAAARPSLHPGADGRRAASRRIAHVPVPLQGEVPDPSRPPSGCRFHPRCPERIERCFTDGPELEPVGAAQDAACWVAASTRRPDAAPPRRRTDDRSDNATADEVAELAAGVWEWRARQQPAMGDDIPRLPRPAGWLPDFSAGPSTGPAGRRDELVARWRALDVGTSTSPPRSTTACSARCSPGSRGSSTCCRAGAATRCSTSIRRSARTSTCCCRCRRSPTSGPPSIVAAIDNVPAAVETAVGHARPAGRAADGRRRRAARRCRRPSSTSRWRRSPTTSPSSYRGRSPRAVGPAVAALDRCARIWPDSTG